MRVLAEKSVDLPDDGAVESCFGKFLVVVCVVQILCVALCGDLEAVGRARAQGGVAAGHELGASAVRFPANQTVLVHIVVLVRQVDVVVLSVRERVCEMENGRAHGVYEVARA